MVLSPLLPSLSVFFPCHNEAENITALLEQALREIPQVAKDFEIIVIDDGSTDRTAEIAAAFAQREARIKVVRQNNRGYGGALKTGFASSKFEWVFFSDADLQFDLAELQLLAKETQNCDFILGYRRKRVDGVGRRLNQLLLRIWARLLIGLPLTIRDINCAFKLLRRESLLRCLPLKCEGAMVSTELLAAAHKAGISITQVGVTHFPRTRGTQTGAKPGVIARAIRETLLLLPKRDQ